MRLPPEVQAAVDGDDGGADGADDPSPDASSDGSEDDPRGTGVDGEAREEPAGDGGSPWGWLLGGIAGAVIIVVLLRSLRPR
ncbi:hypothetical protein [Nocardioides sp. TF02-7]|uniref:hypothetical protein n=1 Tax=Nocardioides sp. TF02-7 TaxID=2917724 RepID=UPI001F0626F0|nr:hypothetical protein [Nocardioides sp. TF02-7]UMG93753.1 hypothetical protein MF408_06225 [Nocardioides sp. TF02-7]